jgi:DNA-binding SARP family transcriptional activator
MAQLDIRLLGAPVVLIDGEPAPPPKGAKAWGLLAFLASTRRAHPRTELAELLFGEAADPLGALRWNLAALRRLLGRPDALKGDSICFDPADAIVDVVQLDDGLLVADGLGPPRELLAGLSFAGSPEFELWLAAERARLARRGAAMLREGALRALAAGDHDLAVRRAEMLVSLDPLDEGHHALLIRAHALSGDAVAARARFEHCRAVLHRELAIEPGPAVVAAVHVAGRVADPSATVDRRAVDARMTVAWQSFLAGAVDHGVDLGRLATAMADRGDDPGAQIMARLFFAAMLSMAVRGWDEAAATATEALHLAEQGERAYEQAMARSVLAGIELMRADYATAVAHATIGAAGCGDPGARALNLAFLAAAEADAGRHETAARQVGEAVELAEASADPIAIVYTNAYAGYVALVGDDPACARGFLERATAAGAAVLVLLPWPLAMLAEVEVRAGRLEAASELAARAEAMSATTGIVYQQALARRAHALVSAARGNHDDAIDQLTVALALARRTTGEGYAFHWPIAWILGSLAEVTAPVDAEASRRWADALRDQRDGHPVAAERLASLPLV